MVASSRHIDALYYLDGRMWTGRLVVFGKFAEQGKFINGA